MELEKRRFDGFFFKFIRLLFVTKVIKFGKNHKLMRLINFLAIIAKLLIIRNISFSVLEGIINCGTFTNKFIFVDTK